jgi:hypothetical protein
MKRIPIAKLTRGSSELTVYYDDYWDDIDSKSDDELSDLPDPLPDYTIKGDKDLVQEFEDFVLGNQKILRWYAPMPWSKAGHLSDVFAKEKGIDSECILPKKYEEMSRVKNDSNIRY